MNNQETYEKLSELIERITRRIEWWKDTRVYDSGFRHGNVNALLWVQDFLDEWRDAIDPQNHDYTTKT
jgi:hypothetical protein